MRPQRRRQQRRRSGGGATMRRFEQRRRSGGGATMRRFETTGALTEWSGSVEKCECRGGSVAPPGRRAEANLPHWLLIGGGRHGRLSHVPRVAEVDPQYIDTERGESRPCQPIRMRATSVMHVASVPLPGTEYGAKIAFSKGTEYDSPKIYATPRPDQSAEIAEFGNAKELEPGQRCSHEKSPY